MLDMDEVRNTIQNNYHLSIENIEFNRDGGSLSYIIYADHKKYFLRIIRPELMHTALQSIDIHLYLYKSHFSVPRIVSTKDKTPYVQSGEQANLFVLYDFIEGQEPGADDMENVGKLVGRFHQVMKGYTGKLVVQDKRFFIDRYVEILRKKRYPKADVFDELGNVLWEKVKNLPRGYCHGDLYRGNVHKSKDGAAYILDFDTSCNAFPIYDIVLFCNETDYFGYKQDGLKKTQEALNRFLAGYRVYNTLSQSEIASFGDLMAVYHFQVQATIIEIYGLDCVDEAFVDNQLDWIQRWLKECEGVSWG